MSVHYAFADYPVGHQPSDETLERRGVRRFGERRTGPARLSIMRYSTWHPGRDGEAFEVVAPTLNDALRRLKLALDPEAQVIESYSA